VPVGIDVERRRRLGSERKMAATLAVALSHLQGGRVLEEADVAADFLGHWVRLEALCKCRGSALGDILADAERGLSPNPTSSILKHSVMDLEIPLRYCGAVATEWAAAVPRYRWVSVEDLLGASPARG
jgi:phosphopantetheinyl transferase